MTCVNALRGRRLRALRASDRAPQCVRGSGGDDRDAGGRCDRVFVVGDQAHHVLDREGKHRCEHTTLRVFRGALQDAFEQPCRRLHLARGHHREAGAHTLQRSRLCSAARTRCDVGGDNVSRIRAKVPSDETGKVGADLIASHDDFFLFLIGTTTPAEASSSARRWRARKSRTFTAPSVVPICFPISAQVQPYTSFSTTTARCESGSVASARSSSSASARSSVPSLAGRSGSSDGSVGTPPRALRFTWVSAAFAATRYSQVEKFASPRKPRSPRQTRR